MLLWESRLLPVKGSMGKYNNPGLQGNPDNTFNREKTSETDDPGGGVKGSKWPRETAPMQFERQRAAEVSAVKIQCVIRRYLASKLAVKRKDDLHTELRTRQQATLAL